MATVHGEIAQACAVEASQARGPMWLSSAEESDEVETPKSDLEETVVGSPSASDRSRSPRRSDLGGRRSPSVIGLPLGASQSADFPIAILAEVLQKEVRAGFNRLEANLQPSCPTSNTPPEIQAFARALHHEVFRTLSNKQVTPPTFTPAESRVPIPPPGQMLATPKTGPRSPDYTHDQRQMLYRELGINIQHSYNHCLDAFKACDVAGQHAMQALRAATKAGNAACKAQAILARHSPPACPAPAMPSNLTSGVRGPVGEFH